MAKKRGRKRKNDLYFGPEEEEAVVEFLVSDDYHERNKIYNERLRSPIHKMIESIIRKYKLYRRDMSFEDLHSDTLTFLIMKAEKFNPEKGTKAYSYFGTICKNYLLGSIIKDDKVLRQHTSYEDAQSALERRDDMQYTIDGGKNLLEKFIISITDEIKKELEEDGTVVGKKKLSENEKRVGLALIDILDDWESIFGNLDGNRKYNKNQFLADVREYTNLTTKDIRTAMKRYKKIYNLTKAQHINDGLI